MPWLPLVPLLAIPFLGTSPERLELVVLGMQASFLLLALLCAGVSYGLFRRLPQAWPLALGTSVANAGLSFVVVPGDTLQLVFMGLSIANACILVWIRTDFQPTADGTSAATA